MAGPRRNAGVKGPLAWRETTGRDSTPNGHQGHVASNTCHVTSSSHLKHPMRLGLDRCHGDLQSFMCQEKGDKSGKTSH